MKGLYMKRRPRSGDTGLLGQRRHLPPDPHAAPVDRAHPDGDAPTHLLFQIGRAPKTVWLIGRVVKPLLSIGRSDSVIDYNADVDLTPYDAVQCGVSRQHVELLKQDNALYVKDKHSRNGTALNDKVLDADTLYPIHDGDTLELGALSVTIWFVFNE